MQRDTTAPANPTGPWPANPAIYEISTWPWLAELGQRYGRPVALGDVPAAEWDAVAELGFDAVWLMGVWERSPAGIRIAREHPALQEGYRQALPDHTAEDIVGSPYCIRRYVVDAQLGGPDGLAAARSAIAARGMRLMLDFVPNHVARDHPWVAEHPEYFVPGDAADLAASPDGFFTAGERIIACGRDPYFPAWTDVAQLNAFDPDLRRAVVATLDDIAAQCDGVRCDMAMLLISRVFAQTWGARPGPPPAAEYWQAVIGDVRARHPHFLFAAEAYWDLEWELQQLGFDYCYDKRLYDRLVHEDAAAVRGHLTADMGYQAKLLRFIENHDEPRAAGTFPPDKLRAAAVAIATLPGARLLFEGQLEGRKVRLPVQLGRFPEEEPDRELRVFYETLLRAARGIGMHAAEWRLCETSGWPDNQRHRNLVAWCWRGERRTLVVANLSGEESQGRVHLPWDDLAGRTWTLTDALSGQVFERRGDELASSGLYTGLSPWGCHLLTLDNS
jgi:hypothetical protein